MTAQHTSHESGAMRAFVPGLVLGLVLGLGIGAFAMPFFENRGAPDLASAGGATPSATTPPASDPYGADERAGEASVFEGLTPEQVREALEEYRATHTPNDAPPANPAANDASVIPDDQPKE